MLVALLLENNIVPKPRTAPLPARFRLPRSGRAPFDVRQQMLVQKVAKMLWPYAVALANPWLAQLSQPKPLVLAVKPPRSKPGLRCPL